MKWLLLVLIFVQTVRQFEGKLLLLLLFYMRVRTAACSRVGRLRRLKNIKTFL